MKRESPTSNMISDLGICVQIRLKEKKSYLSESNFETSHVITMHRHLCTLCASQGSYLYNEWGHWECLKHLCCFKKLTLRGKIFTFRLRWYEKNKPALSLDTIGSLPLSLMLCDLGSKLLGPDLEFLHNLHLLLTEQRWHREEMFLQAVDEWNGEFLIHHILLCHYDQSGMGETSPLLYTVSKM